MGGRPHAYYQDSAELSWALIYYEYRLTNPLQYMLSFLDM